MPSSFRNLVPILSGNPPPDLSDGECVTSKNGRQIAERALLDNSISRSGFYKRNSAKTLCERCPVLERCKGWIEREEYPRGSWGGVYAGLDIWQRAGITINRERGMKKKERKR